MSDSAADQTPAVRSLTKAQHDAWCLRAALISRQQATVSMPGDAVFTIGEDAPTMAFSQLGSYGATHGGFGLVKTSRRTWQVLQRAGIPVPDSRTFSPEDADRATAYAHHAGFPVIISSLTGFYRRWARTSEEFTRAFADAAGRVRDQVLVSTSVTGQTLRLLVRDQKVLAAAAAGGRKQLSPDDVDPSLIKLAVDALQAIPGLDLAAVTLVTPRLQEIDASREALVERIARSPHVRDFAAGSPGDALRLADELVQAAAKDLQVPLSEPSTRVTADLTFTGVPDPQAFTDELAAMVDALPRVTSDAGPQMGDDNAELRVSGPPSDAALIITRAIGGFGAASSAHMVQCRPV